MKISQLVGLFFTASVLCSCDHKEQLSLFERTKKFQVSECQIDCRNEPNGVKRNFLTDQHLNVRLGYEVNCSWKYGYLVNLKLSNDSLILGMDRPHEVEFLNDSTETRTYVNTDCNCYYFFDFVVEGIHKKPAAILVNPMDGDDGFRSKPRREIIEIEEILEEGI